ncbi:MAG TPA: ABC transporter permease [Vicinamibacteria bacterium]|nr:ABC transporter permease [Vicinamibacteria bacterium]
MVGVVFGVAAVVAMSSVGEGARREAVAQIAALGIDSVTLRARPPAGAGEPGLSLRDADSVGRVVPGVVAVAPVREAPLPLAGEGGIDQAVVVGTTPAYREAARLALSTGRFLTAVDVAEHKRVAVLGAALAEALFPTGGATGQRVQVGSDWFDVVGVLEARASARGKPGPIRARDVNRALFVPLPALDRGRDLRADGVDEIVLRVAEAGQVAQAAEVAQRAAFRSSGGAAFDVVVPREILRQKERTQRIFNVVTGAVAFIGLLVGGIGIMNIMLASVAERTREVGIRRALGATRTDVAAQFLAESSLLTAAGGMLGALGGLLGASLIQRWAEWPTALSPSMLALAVLMALVVGVGFGFYPAWRAAHLQPMDALRQ